MAALLLLPTELIICIYKSCTIQTAASLYTTNKQLYSVWLENTDCITEAILRSQIPAYEAAIELAILEEIWIEGNKQLSSTNAKKLPIHLFVKRFFHIARCATNTGTWWHANLAKDEPCYSREGPPLAITHAAYFLMRKILLSRKFPDAGLHESIRLAICAVLEEERPLYNDIHDFLFLNTAHVETARRYKSMTGEIKASEREMRGSMGTCIDIDEWDYIHEALSSWRRHRVRDRRVREQPAEDRVQYPVMYI